VISAHWWKKWMDYVSFGDFSHENEKKEDSFETSPIKEERGVNRPGKIINRFFFILTIDPMNFDLKGVD